MRHFFPVSSISFVGLLDLTVELLIIIMIHISYLCFIICFFNLPSMFFLDKAEIFYHFASLTPQQLQISLDGWWLPTALGNWLPPLFLAKWLTGLEGAGTLWLCLSSLTFSLTSYMPTWRIFSIQGSFVLLLPEHWLDLEQVLPKFPIH